MPRLSHLMTQRKLLRAEIKHRETTLRLAKESLKAVEEAIKKGKELCHTSDKSGES